MTELDKVEVNEILSTSLNEEIARELILEKTDHIDDCLFQKAMKAANGNGWDAAILYELIPMGERSK